MRLYLDTNVYAHAQEQAQGVELAEWLTVGRHQVVLSEVHLAEAIATRSGPLGVKKTLESAHRARLQGEQAAFARLEPDMVELFESEDGREGLMSFVERRDARFTGR